MTSIVEQPVPGAAGAANDLPASTYERMAIALRAGLLFSLALIAAAVSVLVLRSGSSPSGALTSPNPILRDLDLRSLAVGLSRHEPTAFLALGVYGLIATPVLRVVTGAWAFAAHRERTMAALSVAILAMLLFGLLVLGPWAR